MCIGCTTTIVLAVIDLFWVLIMNGENLRPTPPHLPSHGEGEVVVAGPASVFIQAKKGCEWRRWRR